MFRFPGFRRDDDPTRTVTRDPDEIAVERYRYLLRTAPPDRIEEAHREAFEQLTPDQRRLALDALAREADPSEVRDADASPASLARVATRAEMRQPGTIERAWGQPQAGWGGGFMGSFLPVLAGAFVGTAIADSMFGSYGYPPGDPAGDPDTGDPAAGEGPGADDPGADGSAAGGTWDDGATADAGDAGGDMGGDFGGDFGGGDFGGF
jgi:hypothetical protein